jgi:murein DD-endopeptidase MepM/ murein hydrolase activator NlpD
MPTTRLSRLGRGLSAVTAAVLASMMMPAGAGGAGCLQPPVDAPISRPFDAPPCRWCAGHRGLTYDVDDGTPVRAAAAGTVTFSGIVVDVRYVVVRHADGLLATYGGLASSSLSGGERVAAGSIVGHSGGALYFGLRTGPDAYVDPQPRLGVFVVPPYLVPTDGTARRPPPEPVLRCHPV